MQVDPHNSNLCYPRAGSVCSAGCACSELGALEGYQRLKMGSLVHQVEEVLGIRRKGTKLRGRLHYIILCILYLYHVTVLHLKKKIYSMAYF